MNFSVLMSVYEKETPEYLQAALDSILVNQTIMPTEVVVVEDGPLNDGLYDILEEFRKKFPCLKTVPLSEKKVPQSHDEIVHMAKRRNPMCHMTVMFRKPSVEKAGGYLPLPYVEDYYLWVRMIATGARLANISETLVYARVGNGMYNRRGNKEQIASWNILNKFMLTNGLVNKRDAFLNQIYIRIFVYMPSGVKKFIYEKILRK